MFRILLRMKVHPGMEQEFEQTWHDSGAVITAQPAHLGQSLARGADEESVYYIVSDWVDEPRFRTYERSAEHREHRARLHPYRMTGEMTTMHVVDAMAGAAS